MRYRSGHKQIRQMRAAKMDNLNEWAGVAAAPFNSAWRAYTVWCKHWTIENGAFRELKEVWLLEEAFIIFSVLLVMIRQPLKISKSWNC